MPIKRSSAKQKGRQLEKKIANDIRSAFFLEERDVVRNPASVTGMDIILSEIAKPLFPYAVECKNQQNISFWKALAQAEDNKKELTPLLVFKRNNSKTYACLEWEEFLLLVKRRL